MNLLITVIFACVIGVGISQKFEDYWCAPEPTVVVTPGIVERVDIYDDEAIKSGLWPNCSTTRSTSGGAIGLKGGKCAVDNEYYKGNRDGPFYNFDYPCLNNEGMKVLHNDHDNWDSSRPSELCPMSCEDCKTVQDLYDQINERQPQNLHNIRYRSGSMTDCAQQPINGLIIKYNFKQKGFTGSQDPYYKVKTFQFVLREEDAKESWKNIQLDDWPANWTEYVDIVGGGDEFRIVDLPKEDNEQYYKYFNRHVADHELWFARSRAICAAQTWSPPTDRGDSGYTVGYGVGYGMGVKYTISSDSVSKETICFWSPRRCEDPRPPICKNELRPCDFQPTHCDLCQWVSNLPVNVRPELPGFNGFYENKEFTLEECARQKAEAQQPDLIYKKGGMWSFVTEYEITKLAFYKKINNQWVLFDPYEGYTSHNDMYGNDLLLYKRQNYQWRTRYMWTPDPWKTSTEGVAFTEHKQYWNGTDNPEKISINNNDYEQYSVFVNNEVGFLQWNTTYELNYTNFAHDIIFLSNNGKKETVNYYGETNRYDSRYFTNPKTITTEWFLSPQSYPRQEWSSLPGDTAVHPKPGDFSWVVNCPEDTTRVGFTCVPCENGYRNTMMDHCETCPIGTFRFSNTTTSGCSNCPVGYAGVTYAPYCAICEAGTYTPSGSSSCISCATGTYDHDSDPTTPCISCGPHTYMDETGATACKACGAGTYTSGDYCSLCPVGKVDLDSNTNTECTDCPSGLYTDETGATTCKSCGLGNFRPSDNVHRWPTDAISPPQDGDIRLSYTNNRYRWQRVVESSSGQPKTRKGAIYVYHDNRWGYMCYDTEANSAGSAQIACSSVCGRHVPLNEIKFAHTGASWIKGVWPAYMANAYSRIHYTPNRGVMRINDTSACQGTESSILDCTSFQDNIMSLCSRTYNLYGYGESKHYAQWVECPADCFTATPCQTCPRGTYSNEAGATSCTSCAVGTYAAAGSTSCTSCPVGFIDHDSKPYTPCQTCDAGTYSDEQGATACKTCNAGTYAAAGSPSCTPCIDGAVDHDSDPSTPCQCGAGTYVDGYNCVACTVGTYSAFGSTSCTSCAAGFSDHDSDPSTPCQSCVAGSYAAGESTSCTSCAVGFSDHDSDPSTPCKICDTGTYSDEQGATICEACTNGTYAAAGSSSCTPCAIGTADYDLNPATQCENCSAGFYMDEEGSTLCLMCDYFLGGYTTEEGSSSCKYCVAGKANLDLLTENECEDCHIGLFAPSQSFICFECPPGTIDHDSDPATQCQNCSVGTYADVKNSTSCKICDAGTYADTEASTTCKSCDTGTYAAANSTSCITCLAGSADHDSNPATPCQVCPAGTFTQEKATTCISCDPGTYAPANSTSCTACPAGSADHDSNPATPCQVCPAGTFAQEKFTSCKTCITGTYAPASSASCIACVAGMRDHDSNPTTPCQNCSAGTYSNARATSCKNCPMGTYATNEGTSECTPCASDSYHFNTGATSASTCKLIVDFYDESGCCNLIECGRVSIIMEMNWKLIECTDQVCGFREYYHRATDECRSCPPGKISRNGSVGIHACTTLGQLNCDDSYNNGDMAIENPCLTSGCSINQLKDAYEVFDPCDEAIEVIEIPPEILGCTDELANNFDPDANIDDGSCQYDGDSNDDMGGDDLGMDDGIF